MHPSDPLYGQQWHFTKLGNIEKIWDEFSGAGIHVGVYDVGVELTHPDLAGNYDPSRRVIIDGTPIDGEPNATTPNPHGTAVTGLISASANNAQGGVGVAWGSTFTSVDFLDPSSPLAQNFPNYYSGFHQAVNFDIANHSWNAASSDYNPDFNLYGGNEYAGINIEYDYASANGRGGLGTILVQGVGNTNTDAQYSGLNASRFTVTVAGTQQDGFASSLSNYGACVLVTAPATNIVTTDLTGSAGLAPDDYFDAADNATNPPDGLAGTSLSTPIVSGVVALMLDANPNLGWRDVQNVIAASAKHTGSAIGAVTPGTNENSNWFLNDAANWNGGGMHFSNDYGYGLLNAYNAVRMAEAWSLFTPAQTTANEHSWFNEDDTDRVIPDDGVLQFSVSLLPSPAIEVEHVELRIDLTHADYTQLRIFLVSPSGTETQLFDGSGGTDATADTLLNWTYGAEALRGEEVAGNWTVRVEDTAAGATGTLNWFNLVAYGAAASANDVYHYTDEFLAMKALAGEAGRATLTDSNGGADWIDAAAVTGSFALDLTAGQTSKVNNVSWFSIAAGTVIENAVTGDGNDTITGNGAANKLYGMRGDDTLDGAGGADDLQGGLGSDVYYVDNAGDIVTELAGQGTADRVLASVSYTLGANSEIEVIKTTNDAGAGAINLTGSNFGNIIYGNAGGNTLDGGGGVDLMLGLGGGDVYIVDNASDRAVEAAGGGSDRVLAAVSFALEAGSEIEIFKTTNDAGAAAINLTGNSFANIMYGNAGGNTLDGGGGIDLMLGLGGSDVYMVDNAGDRAIEAAGGGSDRVLASVSFALEAGSEVEVLKTTNDAGAGTINLTGNELANIIYGNAGGNTLDGGGGIDLMLGLGGGDVYMVDNASDRAVEAAGGGSDRVLTSVSFTLEAGSEIEIFKTTNDAGAAALNLTGNGFANIIYGNAGGNMLDGGGGADLMLGLGGNDFYYIDNASDRAIETAGNGSDRVLAATSFTLEAGSEIEIFKTTNDAGTAAMVLTGNEFANLILGNNGINVINGGLGNDTLWGLGGSNYFLFDTALNAATNVDAVGDFDVAKDFIRLENAIFTTLAAGSLPPGAFGLGAAAADADDRIVYNSATGALIYDADGLGGAAQIQFASLTAGLALTNADFVVV